MADPAAAELAALLEERFKEQFTSTSVACGQVCCELPVQHVRAACRTLRDAPELAFAQLIDICGVDYSAYGLTEWQTSEQATSAGFSRGVEQRDDLRRSHAGPRFAVVYHLLSLQHNRRLRLRTFAAGDPPRVDSVVDIWSSANWFEREAFDLFGILFDGHPDLRRILTDYGFVGHPMRKDFPLIGEVEMRYDPEQQRVVYEPVSIEPRTLVPRVIRDDQRYAGDGEADA